MERAAYIRTPSDPCRHPTTLTHGDHWVPGEVLPIINGLYDEALTERGTFFRRRVYKRVGFYELKYMKQSENLVLRAPFVYLLWTHSQRPSLPRHGRNRVQTWAATDNSAGPWTTSSNLKMLPGSTPPLKPAERSNESGPSDHESLNVSYNPTTPVQ